LQCHSDANNSAKKSETEFAFSLHHQNRSNAEKLKNTLKFIKNFIIQEP
jgi:hypothetical protein